MKKSDALWLLALPIYQIIGTARHELSHALAAIIQGAHIIEIHLLPSIHPINGFLWGYVHCAGGRMNWFTMSAPYFCDLIVFIISALLCIRVHHMPRWLWINCFVLGIASPLLDVVYNYQKVFTRKQGDVNYLMTQFPDVIVHLVFLLTIFAFCVGVWATLQAARKDAVLPQWVP